MNVFSRFSLQLSLALSLLAYVSSPSDLLAQRQAFPQRTAADQVRQNFGRIQSDAAIVDGTGVAVQQAGYAEVLSSTGAMQPIRTASQVSLPNSGQGLLGGCDTGFGVGYSNSLGCESNGCGGSTCGSMCGCLGVYGSIEYLMWWEKGDFLPALVTTSPEGTSSTNTGVIGFSSALFGDETLNNDLINGFRITLGTWLNGDQTGIIGRYFNTEQSKAGLDADSNGFPRLGRPFFNTFTGQEDSLLLGFPDQFSGEANAGFKSEARGAEVNIRKFYTAGPNYRVDIVYGYRYMGIDESLRIDNSLRFIDSASIQAGTQIEQFDLFDIENEFHGGELGFMGHSVRGCWTIDFLTKVALGNMNQRVRIDGQTVTTPSVGSPVTAQGGLLTQPSNIGNYQMDEFAVIPEFTASLGYALTQSLDLSIGYSFLYVNHVSRPSGAIDRSVNLTQQTVLDGDLRPIFSGVDTDYLVQGINFGLNFRY